MAPAGTELAKECFRANLVSVKVVLLSVRTVESKNRTETGAKNA